MAHESIQSKGKGMKGNFCTSSSVALLTEYIYTYTK